MLRNPGWIGRKGLVDLEEGPQLFTFMSFFFMLLTHEEGSRKKNLVSWGKTTTAVLH
jgi:hypothetical protein